LAGFGKKKIWRGGTLFLQGFCEKRGSERGVLMVRTWWNRGKSWWLDGMFLGVKSLPLFGDIFLGHAATAGRKEDAGPSTALRFAQDENCIISNYK
jgi:hypothetical protein